MGQKSQKQTLQKLNPILQLNSNIYLYKNLIYIDNSFENIFLNLNIYLILKQIDFSTNKINLNLILFIFSKKINFFKKKLNQNKLKNLSNFCLINILKKKLLLLKVNLIIIKLKIINTLVNKLNLIYLYKICKKFINSLFEKRFTVFLDFLKIVTLFNFSLIKLNLFTYILINIFKRLHKKKHTRFIAFIKIICSFLIKNKFSNNILGIKIVLNGKLRGKVRSNTIIISKGSIPNQTLKKRIDFNQADIFTKYGVYGIKIWVNLLN
uniref:Ribosomal protein S3 n=1 Tax=Synura synuroidea TaxID=47573 RepID=Q9MG96_9STRA|nr:ribosomal protein S3 [Synura synuroidea]AAF36953.1 ribosomal protein S3 [Synura synuroidea]